MIRRPGSPLSEVLRSWGAVAAAAVLLLLVAIGVDPVDRASTALARTADAVPGETLGTGPGDVAVDPATGQPVSPGATTPGAAPGTGPRACPDRARPRRVRPRGRVPARVLTGRCRCRATRTRPRASRSRATTAGRRPAA